MVIVLAKIAVAYFIYIVLAYSYHGMITLPTEGDSITYHIPIAKAVLDGTILDPLYFPATSYLKYSPASSEVILAFFIGFGIPVNLYNIFGTIVLFFATRFLALRFGLSQYSAILFAVSICTLTVIVRWLNTQIIDIWIASFFTFALGLLEKPKKTIRYFALLGICIGMLCGSKFTGPVFSLILFFHYIKRLSGYLSYFHILSFLLFVLLLGFPWYLRNFLLTGNPLYPQPVLSLQGVEKHGILRIQVWRVLSDYPRGFFMTINAFISEYTGWISAFVIGNMYLVASFFKNHSSENAQILRLFSIGIFNFAIYLFLPSAFEEHIAVSVFRYSYPAFIPLILGVFLLAHKYRLGEALSFLAVCNMFLIGFPLFYYPKILFLYLPLCLLIFQFESIYTFIQRKHFLR